MTKLFDSALLVNAKPALEAAAEILLEYDSGAVEGIEELDQKFKFQFGYTW